MKNRLLQIGSVAALALAISGSAIGAMIEGNITFAGGANLDTDSVNTATQVSSWVDPVVASRDGDFMPYLMAGDAVAMSFPWVFDSVGPVLDFWSVGGFTFELTSSSVFLQSNGDLIVKGNGFTSGNGFDATAGTWNFTSQNPSANGVFSFSASSAHITPNSVPDGGTTAALLGAVLIGFGIMGRRRTA